MIKRNLIIAATVLFAAATAFAQEPQTDNVSQEAAKLEAELGKYKDAAPEAAEILVKLVDLYHADARAFGLIRAGQKFVASHPSEPRHNAVMLKLIDGLEAMSRNKELVVACRQFLDRYPTAPECGALEQRLAAALVELNDAPRAADVLRAVWRRQGATDIGREAGMLAISRYSAIGSGPSITAAAELCEEMLDKLPPGEFTKYVGWQGVHEWRRLSQWAKSNQIGAKLLKKGVPADPEMFRELHRLMAEHHANLGQRMNAVESYRSARAIRDDWYVHSQIIENLFHAGAKPAELEPLVNEYLAKYPERPDRFSRQSHLAHAFLRAGDKPRALQMMGALLPFDAYSNGSATVLVQNMGTEPAQLAESERLLREGLAKNTAHAWYLRYVLAFELFRDRVKDPAKTRQMLLELATLSPTDDHHTWYAVDWLLTNAPSEPEFQADVARLIAARREHIHLANYRNHLATWQKNAAANKDLKSKVAFVKTELDKQNADPLVQQWLKLQGPSVPGDEKPRLALLEPANLAKANDAQAGYLLRSQAEWLRHYSPANRRPATAPAYGALTKRFPTDYYAATLYLITATDYGPVELMKESALHLLNFEPQAQDSDLWRRLMIAADQSKDAEMVKRAFAWLNKSQEKFGKDSGYAAQIGDALAKYAMENEALAYWRFGVTHNRQSSESRECALRLLAKMKPEEKVPFVRELFSHATDYHGRYAQWLAAEYFAAGDINNFEAVLREARKRQNERPYRAWDLEANIISNWLDAARASTTLAEADKRRVYTVIRDLRAGYPSAGAELALLELTAPDPAAPIKRLLAYQQATRLLGNEHYDWDRLAPFAQAALAKKDYVTTATLVTGMLANITNAGEERYKSGRDMVAQSYARMGAVGLTIEWDPLESTCRHASLSIL